MKKTLLIIFLLLFLGLAGTAYLFRQQLGGAWTAWQPGRDLPKYEQSETPKPTEPSIPDVTDSPDKEPAVKPLPINETPSNFQLPEGFFMSVFAENLEGPRTMMMGPGGNLMVALTSAGKVVEIVDADGNGKSEQVYTLIEGLTSPHGLESKCTGENCDIFIAETEQLATYEYLAEEHKLKFKEKLVDLPESGRHFTRSLLFLPYPEDQKLLISIGSNCDVCNEEDARNGSVQVLDLNTKQISPYATGLRNAVFMTLHPATGETWVTEMGRDFLGDDLPPDELNVLKEGAFYGWPTCYGQNVHDSDFDKNTYIRNPCMEPFETPAKVDIPAHSAPLGLAFIPEEGWPEDWWHDLLVAYHGSWNRSEPTGYKVVRYNFDQSGKLLGVEDFLTGFLAEDKSLYGRPAGLMVFPGGKIFLSDDKGGRIYQINYAGE